MALRFCTLAMAASLIATGAALSPQDIPTDVPVSSLLTTAQTHLTKGETHEALAYYDAAIARDPSNYLTRFKRGATYMALGRTNQATEDFQHVLVLEPGFEGAHTQLAKIKSKTADWEGARAEYVAANKGPESPEIYELEEAMGAAELAESAANAGAWEECVNHAGVAILVASRSPALREIRSRCRFERGEIEEGSQDLRHVLSIRPGETKPHLVISATTFYGLGDMEGGMAQVRKCLHSDPDSKVCSKLLKQEKAISKSFNRVTGQLQKGQTTTAGRSLVGHGDEPGLIAKITEQVADLREAVNLPAAVKSQLYEKAIEMTCQAYSESNHKDVGKYCDEALELNPQSFWALVHRGKALLKKEEYEASIQTLKDALELDPSQQEKVNPILKKAQIALKRSKTKDYYKVLNVPNDADEKQIKSAYRKASKQYHPDKAAKHGLTKEEAEKKMASVNEAYEVLSDPELRARFDRGDDPNNQERGSPFQGGGSPFHFGGGGGAGPQFKFHTGGQRKGGGGGGAGGWPFGGDNPFGGGGPFGAQFGF